LRLAIPIEKLIDQLVLLPGIGPKTAQRLALHILKYPEGNALALAQAIIDLRSQVFPCKRCGFLTDVQPCAICRDDNRNHRIVCLLEESSNVIAMEKSGYKGEYHILNQHFQLMGGNLHELSIEQLRLRLDETGAAELIVAISPDIDGDILARYIAEALKDKTNLRITRLAHGLPVGGDIEYTDEITLKKALEGRKEI